MFLLLGDDPFRTRLRLAELVSALSAGRAAESDAGALAAWPSADLGSPVGVTRHDALSDRPAAIALSGQAQGLFAAPDERRVVVVDHAEALPDASLVESFPEDASLVLVTSERMPARARRAARGAKRANAGVEADAGDLPAAVERVGGRVERIVRLLPAEMPAWIAARAAVADVQLAPAAAAELAAAVGADTDRLEQELRKLRAFAPGRRVEAADVTALVPGAIESDVFALTEAVVRRNARLATERLEGLLAAGQAPQQILALLVWQFRILLFASRMKSADDAARTAKAIRASSPNAFYRWQQQARGLKQADVIRAYEALYATDLAIKQGRTEPETALLLCVLDLCGVANADPRELTVGEPPRR